MPREKAQAAPIARPKVPMRGVGADGSVVVTKRGNARGAKGAGHRHELGSTGSYREEPECFSGRRQPSCDGTSRMTRECHVRICERLGVRFPGPTRPLQTSPSYRPHVRFASRSGAVTAGQDVGKGHNRTKHSSKTALYSITSSASSRNDSEMVSPSA